MRSALSTIPRSPRSLCCATRFFGSGKMVEREIDDVEIAQTTGVIKAD
jgi:hypothetical protein